MHATYLQTDQKKIYICNTYLLQIKNEMIGVKCHINLGKGYTSILFTCNFSVSLKIFLNKKLKEKKSNACLLKIKSNTEH